MKIEHVALWTRDLERSRHFYETYFGGTANHKYLNLAHVKDEEGRPANT